MRARQTRAGAVIVAADDETSAGGSRIQRYRDGPKEGPLAAGDPEHIEAISAHIERHVGPIGMVWHESVSTTIHVDIHHVLPGSGRDYHTLVTSGMSELPMHVPEGLEEFAYAELVVLLPRSWPLTREAFQDERHYWPIRTMKILARFPHEYSTWLGTEHTLPNGNPPEPYAEGTELCCTVLTAPVSLPEEFFTLELEDRRIHFLTVVPLHADEMELKLNQGADALYERLEEHGISDVIDARRKSACAKRRRWF